MMYVDHSGCLLKIAYIDEQYLKHENLFNIHFILFIINIPGEKC